MSSDFFGDEGRGYADDDIASPSSSLVAITGTGARASPSGNSSDLLVDSDASEEVAIHVDSTGAWDGKPRAWPTVPGYDWVPHEVRQISSSFHHRQPFRDLIGHICLVKAAADARHLKLAICQMTERVCHDRGNYPTDFCHHDLTLRLAETERIAEEDKKKASTLLAEARATQRRMQRSLDDAKLDLQKATSSSATLMAERDSLHDRVTKLEAENKLLVPTDDPRLDVSMMVVDNKLVPVHIPPSSPPVAQNVDTAVEVVGETGEAGSFKLN
ncbi:hypothetical protein LR48_Vigan07g113500 [Vigna angularis]|uniref:Uncharacterized protein n=1 Tax=Phaseolus angularis TaxID=3914 RepID=A0A0L9UXH7_PHAAN|nr:hypothetical protein LR48_Vigan07g113500 [Vigna angularis]